MSEVNSIRGYLQGKRTEERIIGVMMLNQILGSDDGAVNDQTNSQEVNVSRAKKEELLMESLVVPGVQFIVRMVETVDAGGRSVPIQLAGLSYIAHACNLGSQIADKFLDAMGILVKVYLTSVNNVVREQTGSAISLLSMVSGTNGKQCVVASILQCVSQHTIDRPFEVLQFLVDIIMTPCLETSAEVGDIETTSSSCEELLVKNPRLLIPAADCPSFRSLIIQGLHGAAPESVRDITLQCCRELLLPVSMSSIVAPHWTFIGSQDPSSGRRKDSFPLLLCSILRGELSILTDEIIFIATHSPESLAQDQSNSISSQSVPKPQKPQQQQPRGETITPTAAGATGTASANDATGSLLGTQTSVSMTSTNRSSHFFRSRIHRTIAMFVTCLQLLESVLHMLVDSYAIEKKRRRSSDDDNNDMKEKGNPLYGDPIIESDPATVTPATNTLKERHASERYQTQRNEEEYDDDDDDDDDKEKEDEELAVWENLPIDTILEIKSCIYGIMDDLFGFLKDCAEVLSPTTTGTNAAAAAAAVGGGQRHENQNKPRDAGSNHVGINIGQNDVFLDHSILRTLLCALLDLLSVYLSEDVDLHAQFLQVLPHVLQSSEITVRRVALVEALQQFSDHHSSHHPHQQQQQQQYQQGAMGQDLPGLGSRIIHFVDRASTSAGINSASQATTKKATTSADSQSVGSETGGEGYTQGSGNNSSDNSSNNSSNNNSAISDGSSHFPRGEVLLYLIQPLNVILDQQEALANDEKENVGDVGSTDPHTASKLNNPDLDKLFDCFPHLLPRFMKLVQIGCDYLQQQYEILSTPVAHLSSLLSILPSLTMLTTLIHRLIVARERCYSGELALLVKGEGDIAILSQLGISATQLQSGFRQLQSVKTKLCVETRNFLQQHHQRDRTLSQAVQGTHGVRDGSSVSSSGSRSSDYAAGIETIFRSASLSQHAEGAPSSLHLQPKQLLVDPTPSLTPHARESSLAEISAFVDAVNLLTSSIA